MKKTLYLTILAILLAGCAAFIPSGDLVAKYAERLPEKPDGFEWMIVEEDNLAVLVPDGWYFKAEDQADIPYGGFYITKDEADEANLFSTGLSVLILNNMQEDADEAAIAFLQMITDTSSTKEIVGAWDFNEGTTVMHQLQIKTENTYADEPDQHKTIHYITFAKNTTAYFIIFESPTEEWDQAFQNYGLPIMNNLVILAD